MTVAVTVIVIIIVVIVVVMVLVLLMVMVVIVVVMVDEMSVLIDHRSEVMVVALAVGIVTLSVIMIVVVMVVAFTVRVIAFILIMVVVMVVAFTVRIVAFALSVVVIMVVMVLQGLFVDEIVDTGVVDGVKHLVGELVLVNVEDCAHEVETDLVGTGDSSVVLDTVVHVDQVEGDPLAFFVDDGGLDVSEETAALALNEFSDGKKCGIEFGLGVCIEVVELSAETCGAASRLLDGVLFVSAHCISSYAFSRLVPSLTETGITGFSGKRSLSHAVASSISPSFARSDLLIRIKSEPCI